MRLITQEPEFTWSGTGYIIGVFTVLGVSAGLVSAGRARGWGRLLTGTRIVAITLSRGCFMAAGSAMFPTVVPAAWSLARSRWPRLVRAGLVLFGAGPLWWSGSPCRACRRLDDWSPWSAAPCSARSRSFSWRACTRPTRRLPQSRHGISAAGAGLTITLFASNGTVVRLRLLPAIARPEQCLIMSARGGWAHQSKGAGVMPCARSERSVAKIVSALRVGRDPVAG